MMMDPHLRDRLRRARKTIDEAASESLKSTRIDDTVLGRGPSGVGTINSASAENAHPNHLHDAAAAAAAEDDEYEAYQKERSATNAAFQLGMILFGDDVAAIERAVVEQLSTVEEELGGLMRDLRSGGISTGISGTIAEEDEHEDGEQGEEQQQQVEMDEASMEAEIQSLSAKAAFLKRCSTARMHLDEEERMTLDLLSAEAKAGATSSLVSSAELLSKAEKSIQEAEKGLEQAEHALGRNDDQQDNDLEAARRIAASISAQVRRRRSDLKHRAAAAVDRAVQITAEGIVVASCDGASTTGSGTSGSTSPGSSSSSLSLKSRSHDSLADAYDALAILSSGQGLRDVMQMTYSNLFELLLEPMLGDHVQAFRDGHAPPTIQLHRSESRGVAGVGSRGMTYKLDWNQQKSKKTTKAEDVDAIATWCHILDVLTSLLKFVREHVLLHRTDLCRMFGTHLFGSDPAPRSQQSASAEVMLKPPSVSSAEDASPLLYKMVRAMWDTCLPSTSSLDVLAGLSDMATSLEERTASFENDLLDMELLLSDNKDTADATSGDTISILSPLSDFASNFERRFGEKRRTMLLSEGRDLLLKGDYHNTTTVGVDVKTRNDTDSPLDFEDTDPDEEAMAMFALHKSSVSQVAYNLMALVRKTMDDAVDPRSCDPSAVKVALPPQLYRTARELLDLFRAIVPSAYGNEVASVPRTAAVLHNDCVFLAHNCLTLGLEYKEKFPATAAGNTPRLRNLCTFVDLVSPFRELAERTMGSMIDRQKPQLLEMVGSRISILREALRSNESVVEWTDAETALTGGTYHLRHLSQAWRPVLSRQVYGLTMGNLVDTIFCLYLDQVLTANDISEPASHFIGALFRNAIQTLSDLFDIDGRASGVSTIRPSSSVGDSEAFKTARANSSYWDKFSATAEFMYMSLADITVALGEGTFRSLTAAELSKLIVAAFDDSQKRAALLKLLASTERH